MTARTLLLAHGYTLGDLDDCARVTVRLLGRMGMDWHDRYDLAYSAIAEHLYTAEQAPTWRDLVAAGRNAIYATVRDSAHHHGFRTEHHQINYAAGPRMAPGFWRYWSLATAAAPFEERILERLTLATVLAALPQREREVLGLLATSNYQFTALALELTQKQTNRLITKARNRAQQLWYDHETPRTLPRGHTVMRRRPTKPLVECGSFAAINRHRRRREPLDEACREVLRTYQANRTTRNQPAASSSPGTTTENALPETSTSADE